MDLPITILKPRVIYLKKKGNFYLSQDNKIMARVSCYRITIPGILSGVCLASTVYMVMKKEAWQCAMHGIILLDVHAAGVE